MTVLELSTFIKAFEERYGVTAAAPAAAAVAAPAASGAGEAAAVEEQTEFSAVLTEVGTQQDPGHQGRSRAHRPWPQGGQGPRRRSPQADQGRGRKRRGREGQGRARGAGRQGRHQVAPAAGADSISHGGCARRPLILTCSAVRRGWRRGPARSATRRSAQAAASIRLTFAEGARYHMRSVSAAPVFFSMTVHRRVPLP